jgi:sarcosine oxidase
MPYVREADIVIVGAGVMGAATARALRASGRRVVVLERYVPANRHGSSHGRSRIFRLSYPEAEYVRMAQRSLELWRELEADTNERLLTILGGIDLGDSVATNAAALQECGAAYEVFEGKDLVRRFPHLSMSSYEQALFQPDGGIVAAELAVSAFLRSAVAAGVELIEDQRVERIELDADRARVHTQDETFQADVIIVTAGAWARPLLATVGIDLPVRVTRETVAYFELLGGTPPTICEWGSPTVYMLPSPGQGIKAAQHIAGPEVDPDSEPKHSVRSVEVVSEWIQRRIPNANPTPHLIETCLYTNAPDERFVIERHGPIVVGSPCSGHGFKFAPLVGERLASLAEGQPV